MGRVETWGRSRIKCCSPWRRKTESDSISLALREDSWTLLIIGYHSYCFGAISLLTCHEYILLNVVSYGTCQKHAMSPLITPSDLRTICRPSKGSHSLGSFLQSMLLSQISLLTTTNVLNWSCQHCRKALYSTDQIVSQDELSCRPLTLYNSLLRPFPTTRLLSRPGESGI